MQDERPVDYGDGSLDMSPYCSQALSRPPVYQLVGVVDHAGSTESGHFIARCKAPTTGRWYRANDSVVVEGSSLQLTGLQPYMLLYQLKA